MSDTAELSVVEIEPGVSSFPIDDEAVLFDARTGELFILNQIAACVWSGLAAGLGTRVVAKRIAREAGAVACVDAEDIMRDCTALVDRWKRAGLIKAAGRARAEGRSTPSVSGDVAAVRNCPARTERQNEHRQRYRVADSVFEFVGDSAAITCVNTMLGHAIVPFGDPARVNYELRLIRYHEGWLLALGNRAIGECSDEDELAPLIHATVLRLTYEAAESLVAIHASAVARGNCAVLLPGVSGSGKSTLTAALVASGYDYCTDDLALLSGEPLRLRPLPLRIGLKRGSWLALRDFLPELRGLPEHERADGKSIKYLLPDEGRLAPASAERSLDIGAIVFPAYDPAGNGALAPIPRSEAFVRLTEAGYDLRGTLNESWVEAVLRWLAAITCYELRYSSLQQAVHAFSTVLR